MPLRLKILSLIFIVLLGLVFLQHFSVSEDGSGEKVEVAIADTASINMVIFTRPSGEKATIEKNSNGIWLYNRSFEARKYLMDLLFTGLSRMQVKREVSESVRQNTLKAITSEGYLIKIAFSNGRNQQEFYLAANPADPNSTLYMEKGSEIPYIVLVPGFEGSLSNLFALKKGEWRDKELFVSSPENLQLIKLSYPDFPGQSFEIRYNPNGFSVEGVTQIDSTKLGRYLLSYRYLTVYDYIEGGKEALKKEMGDSRPLAIIEMESLHDEKVLEVYEKKGKFFGYIDNENEFVSLRPEVYSRLLVKKAYFYLEEEP